MFAFAAKPDPNSQRINADLGVECSGSDNEDYRTYALSSSDELRCAGCARPFRAQWSGHRFCSHACYSASLVTPIADRLWAKVNKHGPIHPTLGTCCWPWTGALTGSGGVRHGQIMWRGRYRTPQKVHRIVWELTYGLIPADRQINHHCDNPICCRPEHLYLGTQDDNMKDASKRGRFTVPKPLRSA